MCEYSRMTFPNRLAKEGEILVTHRLPVGLIEFVSPNDLGNLEPLAAAGFWTKAKAWFALSAVGSNVLAVCIPLETRLKVRSAPQRRHGMPDLTPGEELVFTQSLSGWNQVRDALRTERKSEVLLQAVGEGLEIEVVSLSLEGAMRPGREEQLYSMAETR